MPDINRQLEPLTAFLEVIREEEPEALPRVIRELSRLLGAKKALAFGVRVEDGKASLTGSLRHELGARLFSPLGRSPPVVRRARELLRTQLLRCAERDAGGQSISGPPEEVTPSRTASKRVSSFVPRASMTTSSCAP